MSIEKNRNNGEWTEARFRGFIKSALRNATMRWGPINKTKKEAWVERGKYLCAGCGEIVPLTVNKKKNVFVDHIEPVVSPEEGFKDWDTYINRMFCEMDNLQVLCKNCHDRKTREEKERRKDA